MRALEKNNATKPYLIFLTIGATAEPFISDALRFKAEFAWIWIPLFILMLGFGVESGSLSIYKLDV